VEGSIMVLSKRFLLVWAVGMKAFALCAGDLGGKPIFDDKSIFEWLAQNDARSTEVSLFSTGIPPRTLVQCFENLVAQSTPASKRRVPDPLPQSCALGREIEKAEIELNNAEEALIRHQDAFTMLSQHHPKMVASLEYQTKAHQYEQQLRAVSSRAKIEVKRLRAMRDNQSNQEN
jgi:hypothetical protein